MKSVPTSAFSSSTKTTKKLKMMYSSSEDESSDEEPQLTQSIHMETETPQEDMLKRFKKVLDQHVEMINRYEDNANDAMVDSWNESPFQEGYHINLALSKQESMPGVFEMVETKNEYSSKVIATFTILFAECDRLKFNEEQCFFDPLLLLGSGIFPSDDSVQPIVDEQVCEIQFSRVIGVVNHLYDHAKKINLLAKNLIQQLVSIYRKAGSSATACQKLTAQTFKNLNCNFVFDKVGEVLSTNLIVDYLVNDNTHLNKYMDLFDKMMRLVGSDTGKFGVHDQQVKKIKKRLKKLFENLLRGDLFENSIESLIEILKTESQGIEKNKELQNKYMEYLKYKLAAVINEQMGNRPALSSKSTLSLIINFALFTRLFEIQDKSIFKKIWSIQKIQPVVKLHSRVGLVIAKFLDDHSGFKKLPKAEPKDVAAFFPEALEKRESNFAGAVDYNCKLALTWLSRFNSNALLKHSASSKVELFSKLKYLMKLMKNGMLLAHQNKINIETILVMRRTIQDDDPPDKIQMAIARVVGLLQMIRMEYKKKGSLLSNWTIYINFILKSQIQEVLVNSKLILQKGKRNPATDFLRGVHKILDNNLGCPLSRTRWNIIQICCDFLSSVKGIMREPEVDELNSLLFTMKLLIDWESTVQDYTNCHFMYYLQHRVPDIFTTVVRVCPYSDFNLLVQYFVHGLKDPIKHLLNAKHLLNPRTLAGQYIAHIKSAFEKNVVEYIWKEVDADLRLNFHTVHVQGMRQANPIKDVGESAEATASGSTSISSSSSFSGGDSMSGKEGIGNSIITGDLARFIRERISPVQLFDERIDIKDRVRRQLNKNYYNLTAMTPNDFKTYEEMRDIAWIKYGINLSQIHLPPQTIEQGFDVLRLTRQIQGFVAKYHYNLHTHTFIEITQQTKQIKAISVKQFTNSLKTHGLGVLSATMNAVFQLLLKKFNIFSSFMYQDLINSPLFLEERWFRQNREQLENFYPYSRAEKIKAELLKIGKHKDGSSFFDKFKDQITQMGNAIGYMRLIRSASMSYCAQMMQHLPAKDSLKVERFDDDAVEKDVEYEPFNFGDITDTLKMQEMVVETGKLLDQTMNIVQEHSVESSDYLKLLVKVMEEALREMDFNHLRVFYLIVPPLTLAHIDKLTMAKEKLFKRNMIDAFISDDGFALGVAFILKLLEQNEAFNSLHWFESVQNKFGMDAKKTEETLSSSKKDEEYEEQVSMKRINTMIREYKWLHYSFTAGQIFFKDI